MEVEVIKKKEGKVNLVNGQVITRKLRVAAYARVSTDHEDQQTSFVSQQKYYMEKIRGNPNWVYVDIYADEGISGTQTLKRENFLKMIRDAEEGKIDLILTKSISRFARNTLDTLRYVRMLRNKNIGILFEEENINTLDMAGELLLAVLASVAQQESETISSHVKLGFKMKMERGELVGFHNCYGYTYNAKKNEMYINDKEADIVRLIYKYYIDGYGTCSIAKILTGMNITSPSGKDHWCENTVMNILKNEKYTGDVILGKTYTVDPISHKVRNNNGESDKYFIKDHHEPIVTKEEFEQVQSILNRRNTTRLPGRKMGKRFSFSGRLKCGFCGKSYCKKSLYKKSPAWDCISVTKNARSFCPDSKIMREDVIKSCFMESYHLMIADNGLVVDNFLNELKNVFKDNGPDVLKDETINKINGTKEKLNKLTDLYIENNIDDEVFRKKQNDYLKKISEYEDKLEQINEIIADENKVEMGLDKIKTELLVKSTTATMDFDEDLFEALVDYAIIGGYNEKDEKENYMIRFIFKRKFNLKPMNELTEEFIVSNNKLNSDNSAFIPILDFISNQHFFVFEKGYNKLNKKLITKVRVRVELEK